MRALIAMACATAACGRIGFDVPRDGTGSNNTASDAYTFCPAGSLLCDDFDSGQLASAWTGTRVTTGGSVAVAMGPHHSGAYALDSSVPTESVGGNQSDAYVAFPLATTGMLTARGWLNAQAPFNNCDGVIFFEYTDTGSGYAEVVCDTDGHWTVTEFSAASGVIDHPTHVACGATGTWTCVELDYTLGSAPRIQLFVDDMLEVDDAPADPSPMFDSAALGATRAQASGFEVLVDDVTIAHSHIGCGK